MLDVRARLHVVAFALCAVLGGLFLTGCTKGQDRPRQPVSQVKGRVLANGVPAAHAKIFLVPLFQEPDALRPRATTGSDGTFEISTYGQGDGAPPGEYAVGISWRGPPRKGESSELPPEVEVKDFGKDEGRFDYFKNRYRDPKSSGITVKVEAGPTVLPDINLK